MTMRLIDADALLAEVWLVEVDGDDTDDVVVQAIKGCRMIVKDAPTVELDADDKINKLERTIAELRKINAELAEAHAAESDALAAQTIDELKTRVWVQSGIIDGLEKALRVALDVIKGGDGYATY